jgi:excisionase family DNA binding protein
MEKFFLFTLKEIAAHYRVSVRTVRRWVSEGKLKAIGTGRLTRIRDADALSFEEAFLRERQVSGKASQSEQICHSSLRRGPCRAKRSG